MMKTHQLVIIAATLTNLISCKGDTTLSHQPQVSDSGWIFVDPYAPCTDPDVCCTADELTCVGDPDNGMVCGCASLWDCRDNQKKCERAKPVPGAGTWQCSWGEDGYVCKGTPEGSYEKTGWSCGDCVYEDMTICTAVAPNPANDPQGTGVWVCTVDNQTNMISCEQTGNPPSNVPGTPPNPTELCRGSAEDCSNMIDDDLDGKIDCQDPDCPCKEENCGDGVDDDGDGLVDCQDSDCPACHEDQCGDGVDNDGDGMIDTADPDCPCPTGQECCDGVDNDGDGKIDEGGACNNVGEPCPPNAVQLCDCYCGVHRRCQADGTWGPCKVDGSCQVATITSHSQCGPTGVCDFGKCIGNNGGTGQCYHHEDCPAGQMCDLGTCLDDHYNPCP